MFPKKSSMHRLSDKKNREQMAESKLSTTALQGKDNSNSTAVVRVAATSHIERLRELKGMLEGGLITKQDYEDNKCSILAALTDWKNSSLVKAEAKAFLALISHRYVKKDWGGDLSELTKQIIRSAFDAVDSSGDGVLSKLELCTALHGGEPVFTALLAVLQQAGYQDEDVKKRLIADADLDGDGLIYWGEFLKYFEDAGVMYHHGCLTGVPVSELRKGDKIEARFGGCVKWSAGKIANVRGDGTFDVMYEDGDVEKGVKMNLIRRVGGNMTHACWSYQGCAGPSNWAELSKSYLAAKTGKEQSPINILSNCGKCKKVPHKGLLEYACTEAKPGTLLNNGHTLCISFNVDFADLHSTPGTLTINGKVFELAQFHFHSSSEHTIDGKRYPLECHLVHVAADNQLAVVGILYKLSAVGSGGTCPFLAQLDNPAGLPAKGKSVDIKSISLSTLNVAKQRIYRYNGSLTTPPCSEGVIWSMFATPRVCSSKQLRALKNHMPHNNYRPAQPINKREILCLSS